MTHTRWMAMAGLALHLAGCGDDASGSPDGGGGGSGGNPGGGTAVQLLTFTGPIAGNMTEATTQCERFTTPARLEVTLNGKVGTTDRRVKITIHNYAGSGSYGGSALQVDIAGTIASGEEASVAANEMSGTVDSAMNREGNKVTGAWNCASAPVTR